MAGLAPARNETAQNINNQTVVLSINTKKYCVLSQLTGASPVTTNIVFSIDDVDFDYTYMRLKTELSLMFQKFGI